MSNSRLIARIIGPGLIALGISEILNAKIFPGIAAQVVYLNGSLLFIGGVAIVQTHNRWKWDWSVLVTLTGWVFLLGGLYRMFAPQAPQASAGLGYNVVLSIITAIGLLLTFKGYGPARSEAGPRS